VRPRSSSLRNSGHVAQSPTRFEFAMSTRGAHSCAEDADGFSGLDQQRLVGFEFVERADDRVVASHERAARPVPP
jgi:hypothetical protein